MRRLAWGWALIAATAANAAEVEFKQKPTATRDGDEVTISFEVSKPTDVAVTVVDGEGDVVRHLAAGRLGANAPAPLKANVLAQALPWDRRDDRGRLLPEGNYTVRVDLALMPTFDKVLGWNPKTIGEIKALAVDAKGRLFCFEGYSVPGLRVFGRDGTYERTLLPHSNATATPGIKTLTRADGVRVPFLRAPRDPYDFGRIGVGSLRSSCAMVLTPDGKVLLGGTGSHRVMWLNIDGTIPAPLLGPAVMPAGWKVRSLAMSGDGKFLYAVGVPTENSIRPR